MLTIRISGIIASWEMESEENVTPATLQKTLDEANGEDLLILINSPGGDVYQGLEMYSLIRHYKGKTETRIVSLAASMGSIIALAGDKRSAESTAAYMIHNAWGFTIGDYREMRESADLMEAVTAHLSSLYTERAGIDNEEVRRMMDRETWLFGDSISEFGFEMVEPSEGISSLAESRISAKARYEAFIKASADHAEENKNALKQVAASIVNKVKPKAQTTNKVNPTPEGDENNNEEIIMDLNELMNKHPDIYAQAVQRGVDQEKDRVTAHITLGEAGNCVELAVKNIKDGNTMTATVQAEYMAEGLKKKDAQDRQDDNPENIQGDGSGDNGDDKAETEAFAAKLKERQGGK